MHLPGVRIAEAADLEIDDNQASQPSMEKHQIDPEPCVVDSQATLPADESEVVAKLQQEIRQMLDQRFLKVRLRVLVLDVEKLEYERVANCLLWRKKITRLDISGFPEQGRLVARQRQPLVKLATDLAVKLAHRPAFAQRLCSIARPELASRASRRGPHQTHSGQSVPSEAAVQRLT
jgi:hypothetical protein